MTAQMQEWSYSLWTVAVFGFALWAGLSLSL
jgi:hypothetical protein